jgi:hypothetical protein
MITPHVDHTATLLADGRVLVAGGRTSYGEESTVSAAAELFDPTTGKWTATGDLSQARWGHTATLLLGGKVLVVGGQSGTGDQLASVELYDPAAGQWIDTGNMNMVRSGHTATLLPDGTVLVTGGFDIKGAEAASVEGGMGRTTAELYDPASGRWTTTASMTVPRAGHTATLLPDGTVLVAGGDRGESDGGRSAELYDPSLRRWTTARNMTDERSGHTATLLPDGRVLVAGGFAGSGYTTPPYCEISAPCSAELYDPGTGQWTLTGALHADRIGHTATLLPDGTVLVVGLGTVAEPFPAEIYHPDSGRWSTTASSAKTRGLTATLLLDGRVLATGDFSDRSRVAELYGPATGR